MISPINLSYINEHPNIEQIRCAIVPYRDVEEAELDEMWSYDFTKENPLWLWLALDHQTGKILTYTFGRRKDKVFRKFQELLRPFKITIFCIDDWSSYQRNLPSDAHIIGTKNAPTIEGKNLILRTRIKRLCRKTMFFSKSVTMHDTVIGLLINILDFGWGFDMLNFCHTCP